MNHFSYKKHTQPLISKKGLKNDFEGNIYFSNGSSNTCRVLIAFNRKQVEKVKKMS